MPLAVSRTFQVYKKGNQIVVSTFNSDVEAINILHGVKNSNFASSLVEQYENRGYLSVAQWAWVHVIASEEEQKAQQKEHVERAARNSAEAIVKDDEQMDGIFKLFDKAKEHLQFPKIRLHVASEPPSLYRLSIASERARNPGSITVVAENTRNFIGSIRTDGIFIPNRGCDVRATYPGLIERLSELADDPVRVAQEYGKLTGNCCFCSLALTDPRSTEVGYGPICARHYSLPYPTMAEVSKK